MEWISGRSHTRVARLRRPGHPRAGFLLRSATKKMSLGRRRSARNRVIGRENILNISPWIRLGFFLRSFLVSAYKSLAEAGLLPSFSLNGTESLQQVPQNRLRSRKMIEALHIAARRYSDASKTAHGARRMWKKRGADMPRVFTARQQGWDNRLRGRHNGCQVNSIQPSPCLSLCKWRGIFRMHGPRFA